MFHEVVGEILGHLLGQGRHQDTITAIHSGANLGHEVVDLAASGLDNDLRVDQSRRADDLLDDAIGPLGLVGSGRGRQVDGLADPLGELVEFERAVVHRAGQSEAMLHEGALTAHVALVHASDLRDGDMGLVDDEHEVLGEVVEQTVRGRAGSASVNVTRIVLDTGTGADLLHHLDVVGGAHSESLGLQQFPVPFQDGEAFPQLLLDGRDRPLHALRSSNVVGRREDVDLLVLADDLAGKRMHGREGLDLVSEELHAQGVLLVDREDLQGISAHSEGAPLPRDVVADVLVGDEVTQQLVTIPFLPDLQRDHPVDILLRSTQTVDGRDGRHDDDVSPGQQGIRRGVTQPLDLLVETGVLLDEGIRLRDVRLGLVIVVVRDEVLDGIVREEGAQLLGELGRQGLVGLHDEHRPLQLLRQPRHRGRLTSTSGTKQDDVLLTVLDPLLQLRNGLRLVARGVELTDDMEGRNTASDVGNWTHGDNPSSVPPRRGPPDFSSVGTRTRARTRRCATVPGRVTDSTADHRQVVHAPGCGSRLGPPRGEGPRADRWCR